MRSITPTTPIPEPMYRIPAHSVSSRRPLVRALGSGGSPFGCRCEADRLKEDPAIAGRSVTALFSLRAVPPTMKKYSLFVRRIVQQKKTLLVLALPLKSTHRLPDVVTDDRQCRSREP